MRAKSVNEDIKHLSGRSKEELENYSIIDIFGKCSDLFFLKYGGEFEYAGYVPEGLGIGEGKYIELSIDFKTGQIQNWNPLTREKILEIINSKGNRNKKQ